MDCFEQASYSLLNFIERNPSCYHVINDLRNTLLEQGFTELSEHKLWEITSGGSYFVTRADSALIAFRIPEMTISNFQIVAAHSDSPTFKIKENPEIFKEQHYVSLNVERYGGMLISPWFDRPLSVAGRVVVSTPEGLEMRLVNIDRDLIFLPSLAIHMDRKANEGHAYQIQKELVPLFGDETAKDQFMKLIAKSAGVEESQILSHDLFLYNRSPYSVWGANKEFMSSARIDDLQCAYASMQAFLASHNERSATLCCIFDNEEVGSSTKQGADSTFLSDTLDRISDCLGLKPQEYKVAIAKSFMVSADNGHAIHPNYPEKSDPTNRVFMNQGVVIKYNANQKYTTDAISAAIFKSICQKAEVPVQAFVNHSDVAGGSTLGNIANTHVSMNTVDIGLAQLAMHSPYETAGTKDTWYLIQALREFYTTTEPLYI